MSFLMITIWVSFAGATVFGSAYFIASICCVSYELEQDAANEEVVLGGGAQMLPEDNQHVINIEENYE